MNIYMLAGTLIVVSFILYYSVILFQNFISFYQTNNFASDIENLVSLMDLLSISDYGSWKMVSFSVPENYTVFFNNASNEILITGQENSSIKLKYDLLYNLSLGPGKYNLQLYYGDLSYDNLKPYTIVFK